MGGSSDTNSTEVLEGCCISKQYELKSGEQRKILITPSSCHILTFRSPNVNCFNYIIADSNNRVIYKSTTVPVNLVDLTKSPGDHFLLTVRNTCSSNNYFSIASISDEPESDKDTATAKELLIGEPQIHIYHEGDVHWVKFLCRKAKLYKLSIEDRGNIPVSFILYGQHYLPEMTSDTLFLCQSITDQILYVKLGTDSFKSTNTQLPEQRTPCTLTLTEVPNDIYEPNNSIFEAGTIVEDKLIYGKTYPGDQDWFIFKVIDGTAYRIKSNGPHDYMIMLLKATGDTICNAYLDSALVFTAGENGTYALQIYKSSYTSIDYSTNQSLLSDYSFSITTVPNDTFEPDGTYRQAKWISTDGTIQHRIFVDKEEDYIKFLVKKDSSYVFTSYNVYNSRMYTMKDTLTLLTPFTLGVTYDGTSSLYWTCTVTDTYYIDIISTWRASLQPQMYWLSISPFFNDRFEYNNYPSFAKIINVNDSIPDLKITANDVDWFRFSAQAGVKYKIHVSNTPTYGSFFNYKFFTLFSSDASTSLSQETGHRDTIIWTTSDNADYYIKIRLDSLVPNFASGSYVAPYTLHIRSLSQPNLPPETIRQNAKPAEIGQPLTFEVPPGKQEWVSFTAYRDTSYQIFLVSGNQIDPILFSSELTNAMITNPSYVHKAGSSQTGLVFDCSQSGKYYLKFSHLDTIPNTISLTITTYQKDAYEPDSVNPTIITTDGTMQEHSLGIGDSHDNFRFDVVTGKTYLIEAIGDNISFTMTVPNNSTAKYTVIDRGRNATDALIKFSCTNSGYVTFSTYKNSSDVKRVSYYVKVTSY
jgi:hypothetical protein